MLSGCSAQASLDAPDPVVAVASPTAAAPVPLAAPLPVSAPAGSACDPNYSGACVPVDSDVDCEGGGGNGPSYVTGPVTVVGSDIYKLDRDGNGVACDPLEP